MPMLRRFVATGWPLDGNRRKIDRFCPLIPIGIPGSFPYNQVDYRSGDAAVMVDRRSAVPLHHQFKRLLLDQITSGTLAPGARLSTEREYAAQLGISLAPIRQALADLAHQGYLDRYKSRGTFVRRRKVVEKMNVLHGATGAELATDQPVVLEVLRLERVLADPAVAARLGVPLRSPVVMARRRGKVRGEPVLVVTSYVAAAHLPSIEGCALEDLSLHTMLAAACGCRIHGTETAIEMAPAEDEIAALLALPSGSPILRVERSGFGRDRGVLEYAETHYRADRYRFLVECRPT